MELALLALTGSILGVILLGTLWPAIAEIAAFGLAVLVIAAGALALAVALGDLADRWWTRRRSRAR